VLDIAVSAVTAVIGVWLVSVGLIGFCLRRLNWGLRASFLIAGLAVMMPAAGLPNGGLILNLAGLILGAVLVVSEYVWKRRVQSGLAGAGPD
jgi:TRAP-type uncharacterized transport system fused permease subunit